MKLQNLIPAAVAACSLALAGSALAAGSPGAMNSPAKSISTLNVLSLFTAADVPAVGPDESEVGPASWAVSPPDASLPGKGIAQHPMLFIGEGYNKMFLVNGGKVIWTFSTGKGGEFDDVWMLSNGNILFSRMSYAAEVTPQKKVIWRLDATNGTEIHTVQPIGLDKVMLVENGTPPKLLVINTKTKAVEVEHTIPPAGTGVHGQFRRMRVTAGGTYLAPMLSMNKVVEYDTNFNQLWSYDIPSPWAAIRLHNGNTLITDERDRLTREVNPKGETVWEFKLATDLPPGLNFPDSQSCVRLDNGNTVLCSRGNGGKACQLIEVTPDKKVVWALKDWTNLGPASAVQMLDDPGIPENPGDCQR